MNNFPSNFLPIIIAPVSIIDSLDTPRITNYYRANWKASTTTTEQHLSIPNRSAFTNMDTALRNYDPNYTPNIALLKLTRNNLQQSSHTLQTLNNIHYLDTRIYSITPLK